MIGKSRVSQTRLEEIEARQGVRRWGDDYEPAILANRQEAPTESWATEVKSTFSDRYHHTLSTVETKALVVIMYHANAGVFEIHEGHVLPTVLSDHPLVGHLKALGMRLPKMRGTVAVADSLGALDRHPTVYVRAKGKGQRTITPFPFVGDFLIFLEDVDGPYCINWSVKLSPLDFIKSPFASQYKRNPAEVERYEYLRHRIEEILFAEVGVRTVRVTAEDLDNQLSANLTYLCLWIQRRAACSEIDRRRIVTAFRVGLIEQLTFLDVAMHLQVDHGLSLDLIKIVLNRAIWYRELRVDLYTPLLFDQPMCPEKRDVLKEHAHLFKR